MALPNEMVAAMLAEYAELLQISGSDPFRARNYEKAAKSVAGFSGDVSLLDATSLRQIPGVGPSIAAKITEFQQTGTINALEELRATVPDGVREMTKIPALGPKRAFQLYRELGIGSVAELSAAIDQGRLRDLRGFGPRSEDKLRHGIELARSLGQRVPLNVASDVAERIVAVIGAVPGCQRCEHAGSLRRFAETIGDVDVLAAASDSGPLMRKIVELPEVTEVVARGDTKTSVRVSTGHHAQGGSIGVDLRVVPPGVLGRRPAVLHRLAGAQRGRARDRGAQEAQAVRVRPVRRVQRRPDRQRDRGGGLRQARDGVGTAAAAREHRRGPGRAARRAARARAGR